MLAHAGLTPSGESSNSLRPLSLPTKPGRVEQPSCGNQGISGQRADAVNKPLSCQKAGIFQNANQRLTYWYLHKSPSQLLPVEEVRLWIAQAGRYLLESRLAADVLAF